MDEVLHVGLLTPTFSGITGFDSGIGTHFRHLADGLTAAGHRVSVLIVCEKPVVPVIGLPYEVQIVQVQRPFAALLAGPFSWQLHQWLILRAVIRAADGAARRLPVDIWETTSTGTPALTFQRRAHRAPIVVRVSTTATQLSTTNAGVRHWITRRLEAWEKATVHRAECVLTHSATHRRIIARQFGLSVEDIQVIPHGIRIPRPTSRTPSVDCCRILYVGRLEYRKGIDLLLAALPALLRDTPHASVTLVGADHGGHWEKHWERTAPPGVRDRVHFAGLVDAETLAQHYREADLVVAPSRYESFGLVFVEAMARALPVVALHAPGAIDLIEDNVTGCLVPFDDPARLAVLLAELATDPARRERLGRAARKVVAERYSLEVLAQASAALYRKMLAAAQ